MVDILKKGSDTEPVVYLTFDDGPDPHFTSRLLDLLDLFQARASFFVLGSACLRSPSLLQRIHGSGHAIGNHTFSHRHPWFIDERRARHEVRVGFETIADICGTPPRAFRPPHGRIRKAMLEEAASLGMETVLWTRSAMDWGPGDIDAIGRRLIGAGAGDILLCHDAPRRFNHPERLLAVLPGVLQELQRRNLRFGAVDELLRTGDASRDRCSLSPAQSV